MCIGYCSHLFSACMLLCASSHAVLEFGSRQEMRSALMLRSGEHAQLKKTELLRTAGKFYQ